MNLRDVRGPSGHSNSIRRTLGRRELVPFLYRLGRSTASGLLTLTTSTSTRGEVFVLRRGGIVVPDGELAKRAAMARLQRLAPIDGVVAIFEGGTSAAPPGVQESVNLATWARQHLEAQLDNTLAEALLRELAGIRLALKPAHAPLAVDDSDRRMISALAQPRRLDQIWPLARTPRFRLLAFIHFLRAIDAIEHQGVAASLGAPPPLVDRRARAAQLLGVRDDDDRDTVKRAYRRLARTIHPDLQPSIEAAQRRELERRFADLTAAYEMLAGA